MTHTRSFYKTFSIKIDFYVYSYPWLLSITMLEVNKKLQLCVIGNFTLLLFIILLFIFFGNSESNYWRFGPSETLVIINVKINNYFKYCILLLIITILKIMNVVISEIAHPIISFNIYNPDKKIISEFTKNELQIYGNTMYLIDGIRGILMIMVNITQIDIALFGVIISEFTSIFTIRLLLNEKKFKKDCKDETEEEELTELVNV